MCEGGEGERGPRSREASYPVGLSDNHHQVFVDEPGNVLCAYSGATHQDPKQKLSLDKVQ